MKKQILTYGLLSAVLLLSSGCGTQKYENASLPDSNPPEMVPIQIGGIDTLFEKEKTEKNEHLFSTDGYEYTVKYRSLTPSGVALTTEGYVHVLTYSDDRELAPSGQAIKGSRELWEDALPESAKNKRGTPGEAVSIKDAHKALDDAEDIDAKKKAVDQLKEATDAKKFNKMSDAEAYERELKSQPAKSSGNSNSSADMEKAKAADATNGKPDNGGLKMEENIAKTDNIQDQLFPSGQ